MMSMQHSRRSPRPSQGSRSDSGSYKLVPSHDLPAIDQHAVDETCSPGEHLDDNLDDGSEHTSAPNRVDLLEHPVIQSSVIALIVCNAVVIGLETDLPHLFQWNVVENVFLIFFTGELVMRMVLLGHKKYFKTTNNPDFLWNIFDFVVVFCGIINLLLSLCKFSGEQEHRFGKDATLFRVIRLLRILRVLRIIRIVRFLKQLYLLAYGFLEGAMAVFWVTLLASFMLYICAVMLVRTYGRTSEQSPDYEFFDVHFGTIPKTMFSLFELMSAPDLGPYRGVMFENPPLVVFLVAFIIIGSFGINGLLVALINESILEKNQARIEAERIERESKRKVMQQRCRELFDAIDVNKEKVLPRSELMKCTHQIAALFESLGVNFQRNDLDQMFYIMDYNDTGVIERSEFVQGVVELCDQIRPMSIMELHYQVSKCASKVEQSDLKVDSIVKTVEQFDMKMSQLADTVEDIVDKCGHETAPARHASSTTYSSEGDRSSDRLGHAARTRNAPRSARTMNLKSSFSSAANNTMDGNPALREMLAEHRCRLAQARMNIMDVLMPSPTAEVWRRPDKALSVLSQTVLRLQRANVEVLQTIFDNQERLSSRTPHR